MKTPSTKNCGTKGGHDNILHPIISEEELSAYRSEGSPPRKKKKEKKKEVKQTVGLNG